MPDIQFDRYYRYDDLTQILQSFAEEYPDLVKIESIGNSHEGRDIWLVTVTHGNDARQKPALWVDGNIHASEVSASSACLYLINKLVTSYGDDDLITRCLNTRAFYICPRVNPDGPELALADKPRIIRSSTKPYPYDEEPLGGLIDEDIDGDGRVLNMRIRDPLGTWKPHPDEPRLLVRREPTDIEGEFYRVLPEGHIENFDGVTIEMQPRKEGLDLNRNFPSNWRQDYEQRGAGPYPASEPEVQAMVRFIADHRNITGGITFHTFSGVLLRPYSDKPDDKFPAEDLWTYKAIGKKGTEMTDYPNVSVHHDFKYHPNQIMTGAFDDWLYDHMGAFGWTVEIWSPQRQAGIEEYKFIEWYREHPIEDDLKMLKWSDEVLDGQGYVDWYAFEHPQLGPVELGGWNVQYCWRNPPPQFLEKEIAPLTDWVIWHLMISPRLELYDLKLTALGEDNYHIRLVVHNTGWLPTYVTKKALEKKVIRGVVFEIELPNDATLKTGRKRIEGNQLEGWAYVGPTIGPWEASGVTDERAKVEWVVHAPNGGTAKLIAKHDRAGVVQKEVNLKP